LEGVEIRLADALGGREGEAAGEYADPGEQLLFVFGEELVAPIDRCLEGVLASWCVAGPDGEDRQSLLEADENLGWGEGLGAGGGELDRERQPVQPFADLPGDLGVDDETGRDGVCAGGEQLDRILRLQHGNLVLLLAGEVERLAAGDQQTQVRAGSEQLAEDRRVGGELLEVVQQEQQRA